MVTVGFQHSPREKIFEAVIDSVDVKPVRDLSPRDIEHDNPEFRRVEETIHFMEQIYGRSVSPDDPVTVVRFSAIVERPTEMSDRLRPQGPAPKHGRLRSTPPPVLAAKPVASFDLAVARAVSGRSFRPLWLIRTPTRRLWPAAIVNFRFPSLCFPSDSVSVPLQRLLARAGHLTLIRARRFRTVASSVTIATPPNLVVKRRSAPRLSVRPFVAMSRKWYVVDGVSPVIVAAT